MKSEMNELRKLLILVGSPRRAGNSAMLAKAVQRGAEGEGTQVALRFFDDYIWSFLRDCRSTERVDTRVLQVIYRFKDTGVPFRVGQQMDVFIATDQQRGEP